MPAASDPKPQRGFDITLHPMAGCTLLHRMHSRGSPARLSHEQLQTSRWTAMSLPLLFARMVPPPPPVSGAHSQPTIVFFLGFGCPWCPGLLPLQALLTSQLRVLFVGSLLCSWNFQIFGFIFRHCGVFSMDGKELHVSNFIILIFFTHPFLQLQCLKRNSETGTNVMHLPDGQNAASF